ncbi:aldolase/citrate lyase family protein [Sphingomonas sp.]|uniref:HpcH/HpaI aldolase family protein n=1 Tax=Sphingomonas sp. TaxID=28214 RepID=UPI000DB41BBC|nr:aldolase/citrate lyase family protein [Sphingomonas sp.]PZU08034.1 MAG: aldolase [Sphingomonas sp.]
MIEREPSFRNRLASRERLLGTFLKTPTVHATEILGGVGFDFVVIDAEHAPFGRTDIDVMLLAARAARIAGLVRVPSDDPAHLLSVLDCGATGVLVPHVTSAAMLERIVRACRYDGGTRGFSNSPRAGRYGALGIREHIEAADANVTVLAMIEDAAAIDQIDAIFGIEGLDGAFIGRGDLAASMGAASVIAPEIRDIVMRIAEAAKRHDVPLLAHVGSMAGEESDWLTAAGVTGFIVSSDQGLMRSAALAQCAALSAS